MTFHSTSDGHSPSGSELLGIHGSASSWLDDSYKRKLGTLGIGTDDTAWEQAYGPVPVEGASLKLRTQNSEQTKTF